MSIVAEAAYVVLHRKGELAARARAARAVMGACELCARRCRVDRLRGKQGYCRAPLEPVVASAGPHFGEEPPLVGCGGSGTVFFAYCNLGCVFCQNYDISRQARGSRVTPGELAGAMVRLQALGCHNINLVTPTHFLPQVLEALPSAVEGGLTVPLVWNCGGYESVEALRLLEGVVDIFMPDFKFADGSAAERYCRAADYPGAAGAALLEMHRQVGDLVLDAAGLARRGLLIRHLVMPGLAGNTRRVLDFIAREVSPESYVNIMDQYHPAWQAHLFPEIGRRIVGREHFEAMEYARSLGLHRGF